MEYATAELKDDVLSTEYMSETLNRILDVEHGLSEENVRRRRLFWDEMCYMLSPTMVSPFYISGSVREGVVDTDNEDSDLDIMIESSFSSEIHISNSTNIGFKVLLSEEEGLVRNDSITPIFTLAPNIDATAGCATKRIQSVILTSEVKGPATNVRDSLGICKFDIDFVPAVKCQDFPEEAEEWWYRHRRFDWPPQCLIDRIVSRGYHLVGIGSSPERTDEWRVSFSMAENILVRLFNDTQLKCYFVLKQVLKSKIKPKLQSAIGKDQGDVLCSYHMKTLMFWLIEETQNTFWRKEELWKCIMYCITELRKRVTSSILPHYFIMRINLFANKLNHFNKKIVLYMIDEILEKGSSFLLNCLTAKKHNAFKKRGNMIFLYLMSSVFRVYSIETITDELRETPFKDMPNILRQVQANILKSVDVSDSVEKTCPTFFKFTTACIRLSALLSSNVSNKKTFTMVRAIMYEIKELVDYDMLSGKLKLATIYLKLNKKCECLVICLEVLRRCADPFIYFHSRVDIHKCMIATTHFYVKRFLSNNRKYLLSQWISYDVIFSPLEIKLVPEAVQQEMMREKEYVGAITLPTTCWRYYDPVVYVLFLLITCYNELGQVEDRDKYLKQLEDVVFNQREKHYLVYPEAAINLIHYCKELCRAK